MLLPIKLLRRKLVLKLLLGCGLLWLLLVVYTHNGLDVAMESVWYGILRKSLDRARLQELMSAPSSGSTTAHNPLSKMILRQEGMLSYFHLPKRMYSVSYTEITSANRNTSFPFGPDFTFHIEYNDKEVVIYEDHGPGCVFRMFLLPVMPREVSKMHALTFDYFRDSYFSMIIDGRTFWFSLQQVMEGKTWPFLTPINSQYPKAGAGLGTYTPFCYQESLKITYQPHDRLPFNLFEDTVNCTGNSLPCPVHIYSGVSRYRYPVGSHVMSFADLSTVSQMAHKKTVETAAALLKRPEIYGPESGERCELKCVEVCQTCRRMIYQSDKPGVVTAIKVRVYETATSHPLSDWNQILITMRWDNTLNPQVDRVPLGALFGMAGSENELNGATLGHKKRTCFYQDNQIGLPKNNMTGYFYYTMPFWRKAEIFVEGAESIDTSLLLCFQISTADNLYDSDTTGYFHVSKSYYTDQVTGWRDLLTVDNSWGNIVGVMIDMDNIRARRKGPVSERWAPLEAGMFLFTDGSLSATMMGTGLEDYFSYSHGFALAKNTSYAFNGIHHSAPERKEPLSWHSYRLHVIDAIPFHTSVTFYVEGMVANHYRPEQQLTYEEHWNRKSSGLSGITHTVLYYCRPSSAATTLDIVNFADDFSERSHKFDFAYKSEPSSGEMFSVKNKRFLGNAYQNITYNKVGRWFKRGDKFSFTLKILDVNNGIILRREFYSPIKEWNEKAHVWINGKSHGVWFIPMGTLSEEFVLRDEDLMIHANITQGSSSIRVVVEPLTSWRDIAYHAIVLH